MKKNWKCYFNRLIHLHLSGERNKALLELMYATGIRVSECAGIQLSDFDLYSSVILSMVKERKKDLFHYGYFAKEALHIYINNGRKILMKDTSSSICIC